MNSPVHTGKAALRHAARSIVIGLGKEERARSLQKRLQGVRASLDPPSRRELRDEHALHVILATVLRKDSNAIDVGANKGSVLESIVRLAPSGQHVAFEPIPHLQEALRARFPMVEVRRSALSDTAGDTEFVHVIDSPAHSGLLQREDLPPGAETIQRISVQTERLDDVLEDGYVPTLLKVDVEGAELQVLRGATETLQRHRPWVLFEHGAGGADLYQTLPTDVFDLLTAVNLRIFDLDGEGPYSRDHFQATFTEPIWNFLAAPA
jgi:FkbM family methyltransferase